MTRTIVAGLVHAGDIVLRAGGVPLLVRIVDNSRATGASAQCVTRDGRQVTIPLGRDELITRLFEGRRVA